MKNTAVVEAIRSLEDTHGRLTPDAVLEAARDPESPLHECFTWNDSVAAHEHRLDQARRLITSVTLQVTYNRINLDVPSYIRDPAAQPHQQGYRNVLRVRSETEMAREALVQEMARAGALLRRARQLALVLEVEDQIDALEAQVANFAADLAAEREEAPAAPPPSGRPRGRWRKGGREARA